MSVVVIRPKGPLVNTDGIKKAIKNALLAGAKGAKVDFDVTTQTWKRRPDFQIEENPKSAKAYTTDEIYGYVDEGTRPHIIAPHHRFLVFRSGYKAKTSPRFIGSRGGGASGGLVIISRPVHHPGTTARELSDAIQEKWEDRFGEIMQRAIDAALD